MKIAWFRQSAWTGAATACLAATAFTVAPITSAQFNTDALKSMQKEGHKILEEEQSKRSFRMNGNLCLDVRGEGLIVRACNDRATQAWRFDDKRRLVANSAQCVNGAALKSCGAGKSQLWRQDKQNRLVNDAGVCLQVQGNPPKGGAKVVAVACSKSANQVWD